MKPRERVELAGLTAPVIIVLVIGFVIPVVSVLALSVRTPEGGVTAGNFINALTSPYYLRAGFRSVVLAVIQTVITLAIATPLAYVMAQAERRLRAVLMILIILPLMTSVVVRSFGWVVLLGPAGPFSGFDWFLTLSRSRQGLLGTEAGMVIAMVQVLIPFAVLPILGVLGRIDRHLEQAARTMGANFWAAIRLVVLPLAKPGIIAAATVVFALSVSSFITPGLIGGKQLPVLAATVYADATVNLNWPVAAAQAVLILFIVLVAMWVLSLFSRQPKEDHGR